MEQPPPENNCEQTQVVGLIADKVLSCLVWVNSSNCFYQGTDGVCVEITTCGPLWAHSGDTTMIPVLDLAFYLRAFTIICNTALKLTSWSDQFCFVCRLSFKDVPMSILVNLWSTGLILRRRKKWVGQCNKVVLLFSALGLRSKFYYSICAGDNT